MTGPAGPVATTAAGPARRGWSHPRSWPWWAQVLAVYAAARAFGAVALALTAQHQGATGWTSAHPSYLEYAARMWDADWYRQIAEHGYPAELPRGADGRVEQNAWAFFPLFPVIARGLMTLTGGTWTVVAPSLALVLGAAAVVVVHQVVQVGAPRACAQRPGLPLATATLVSVFPTAVVLQVAYTESLALLLVAAALLAVLRRRYGAAALAVVALGFTRAVAPPMAVVVAVHAVLRWRAAHRGADRLTAADGGRLAGLLVVTGASGLVWPAVVGWVTGVPDAYLQTQAAWRGSGSVTVFGAWGYVSRFWFGGAAPWVLLAGFGLVAVTLLVPAAWRLGPELHAWPAAYLLYLAAVVEPGSSLARFLLLAFPLGTVTAALVTRPAAARRVWFAGVVAVMLALQVVWVWTIWRLDGPTGWPP